MTLPWAHHKSSVKARVRTGEEVRGGREVTEKGQCENLGGKSEGKWGDLLAGQHHLFRMMLLVNIH